ncbi:MAG: tRNA lysidine(34) synthetase TilS [Cyanobacteria bacterium SID2]|nr:tRNA lysidine(34) synthetase TilS [Cyanobacteria bacterium SID2]MBP0005059.1 tRNA lysidine(34) synthetase TilS [Cyanobacteria bacterium SBC]
MSLWTPLHARVHGILKQRRLLSRSDRILIAVSGGQDSLCLAKLLLDLQPKWSWELAIAHCDHRWRSDSAANAQYVCELAQRWHLPCFQRVATQIVSREAEARQWRYGELSDIAQREGFAVVVTGHTQSDRAETLLYNLLRGAGSNGLQALAWQRDLAHGVVLVRPLLEISRTETAQFCQQQALRVWDDPTNQALNYARNRIRLELLPYLRNHFNPNVETTLARTAELLRADVAYLEREAEKLLRRSIDDRHRPIRLDRRPFQEADLALRRRSLRQFLQQHLAVAPNFEHIEKLTALIEAPNRTQTDPFPGGAIALVRHPWIEWKSESTAGIEREE